MTTFKLKDLDDCGHDTFYEFGRCLYKHTPCGPWVVAVLPDGARVYYESEEGNALSMDTEVQAVEVGSIVEGSEVEVGPFKITDPAVFWDAVEGVNAEADFYWKRDNLSLFVIDTPAGERMSVECGWGDFDWFGVPEGAEYVKARFEEWYAAEGDEMEEGESEEVDGLTIQRVDRGFEVW